MKLLTQYLAVGVAGSLGAMARLAVSSLSGRLFGSGFPVGTFIINITGSLFLGWFYTVVTDRVMISDVTKMAIAVGFVGAYTTFSTYMYESNALIQTGETNKAMLNLLGSIIVGLLAVRVGIWLGAR